MNSIPTAFTKLFTCDLPIIAAPMFLVSNADLVCEASQAGAIGTFPALNFRPLDQYRDALKAMRARTTRPIGVNVIVNKSNQRQADDVRLALDHGVDLIITSLGNPKQVIADAHRNGAKVFCDVTNLEHALKVEDLGCDGVIAVAQGAGGHAGPISPLVLVPWLKSRVRVPVVAAGGIAHGSAIAACLSLGADAVSIGTRFIASREARVDQSYKDAVVRATPEDIVMTTRVSGTPAAVIKTPYVEKLGLELPWIVKRLKEHPRTKNLVVPLVHLMGMKSLEDAALKPTWKTVWTAGQSVGLVDEVLSVREILAKLVAEYEAARGRLPALANGQG